MLHNRLIASQNAAKAFLKELPRHVRVGIVAFAGSAQVVQPVTLSREYLNAAIGSAIVVALSELFPGQVDLTSVIYGRSNDPFAPQGRAIDQPQTA